MKLKLLHFILQVKNIIDKTVRLTKVWRLSQEHTCRRHSRTLITVR